MVTKYIEHNSTREIVIRHDDGSVLYMSGQVGRAYITAEDAKKKTHISIVLTGAELNDLATAIDKMTGGFLHENCDKHIEPEDMPDPADGMVH